MKSITAAAILVGLVLAGTAANTSTAQTTQASQERSGWNPSLASMPEVNRVLKARTAAQNSRATAAGATTYLTTLQLFKKIPIGVRSGGEKTVLEYLRRHHVSHIKPVATHPKLAATAANIIFEPAALNIARGAAPMSLAARNQNRLHNATESVRGFTSRSAASTATTAAATTTGATAAARWVATKVLTGGVAGYLLYRAASTVLGAADTTPPSVTICTVLAPTDITPRPAPTCTPAKTAAVRVTEDFLINVKFSESVTGFTLNDLEVQRGEASELGGGDDSYTAMITPTASGVLTVNIRAGAAEDEAGNRSTAAPQLILTSDVPLGPSPQP